MIKKSITYFSCACIMLMNTARAQQTLTLQQAIDIALKNSISAEIGKNNTKIAGVNNNYGVAGGLPVVSGTLTDQEQSVTLVQKYANPANNKESSNVSSNGLSAGVSASILVTNGERVVTAKKRLETIEHQTHKQLNSRLQGVVVNVMLKYYDIIRQQSYAKALQTSIQASEQKLDIVQKQQNVGLANNADLFQAQVDLNTQVQLLQAQQLVIDQGKTDLLYLLTLNPDSSVNISDTIVVDKSLRLDTVLNNIALHPDIASAEDQVQITRFLLKETAAQRYPSVNVNTGYSFSRSQSAAGFTLLNQQRGPYAGVSVSIPIYNGSIYKRQQQVAGINIANATLQKDTLINNYTANAVKSWQAYQSNIKQLETAQHNYELSQKLLSLVLQRFQLHQATIIDVKNAQQSFESAANLLVNVSYAAKAAEVQLKRYGNMISY
jgi:outer membrane protein